MKKILFLILVVSLFFTGCGVAADVDIVDKDELKQMLSSPDLVVLDVRTGGDWDSSEFKITGAVRADPTAVETWANGYAPDKTYVLYCS